MHLRFSAERWSVARMSNQRHLNGVADLAEWWSREAMTGEPSAGTIAVRGVLSNSDRWRFTQKTVGSPARDRHNRGYDVLRSRTLVKLVALCVIGLFGHFHMARPMAPCHGDTPGGALSSCHHYEVCHVCEALEALSSLWAPHAVIHAPGGAVSGTLPVPPQPDVADVPLAAKPRAPPHPCS